jgi:hypothetical protein
MEKRMPRLFLTLTAAAVLAAALPAATAAVAHHGWADYDTARAFTLDGTIERVDYANPHVIVRVRAAAGRAGAAAGARPANDSARTWVAVLAPPSRMTSRGLPNGTLQPGQSARVYGYPHRRTAGELRAERITLGDRTTELR